MKYGSIAFICRLFLGATLIIFSLNSSAFPQSPPLEIPFVKEWAASKHALRSAEPFNHWNKAGVIPKACSRCHSTSGFRDYIGADGSKAGSVEHEALVGEVISCVACHSKVTRKMTEVTFPSGKKVAKLGSEARCMTCHQGRASTVSVNKATANMPADKVSKKLKFINIHYRAAAATRYGTQAKGGYEYDSKTYSGLYLHDKHSTKCIDCHTLHTFKVEVANCNLCHRSVKKTKDFKLVRRTEGDFDGDGNAKEGIAGEITTLHGVLYKSIKAYAEKVIGTAVVYDSHKYPYFFADKNKNGKPDKNEAIYPNRYKTWTPRLLRAAYNYQFIAKDPGVYTHNPKYVIQLLHDSLADLSSKVAVNMKGMVRPDP